MNTVGFFSGIGGFEEGLSRAGFQSILLSEIDPLAEDILKRRYPGIDFIPDVRAIKSIPKVELLSAGFPCQDLSQAGRLRGIHGKDSGLVKEVFRVLQTRKDSPKWVLFENVPFMLFLDRGRAMSYLVGCLEDMGFTWAYRTIDTRAFGLPQRRKRVFLLASRTEDPRPVLFGRSVVECIPKNGSPPCGFYWTEGSRGLGWTPNGIPTLKAGSARSIPSPPAIWLPESKSLVLPDIRDAERLQGFKIDWTRPSGDTIRKQERRRWRLVGNAVSVPVAKWIGDRLNAPGKYDPALDLPKRIGSRWGHAGWGRAGERYLHQVSDWPVRRKYQDIEDFLKYPGIQLSARATSGFLSRAMASRLNIDPDFLNDVDYHLSRMLE